MYLSNVIPINRGDTTFNNNNNNDIVNKRRPMTKSVEY